MYHTKRIGIFISHIFGSFQSQLCQGIIDTAEEYGYSADIFASMDGEPGCTLADGENSILKVPDFHELSGVIFASGTYLTRELSQAIHHRLLDTCCCPVVEVSQQRGCFPTVSLENNFSVGELAEHLITDHHLTRICYLGCLPEEESSGKRKEAFQQAMLLHQLPVSSHSVCECSYDRDSIQTGLDWFCSGSQLPEAILCYNDRMALILMQILEERGIRVPEDIAVTGFDDLPDGKHSSPPLTTVTFPIYEMGCEALRQLLAAIDGQDTSPVTAVRSHMLVRDSCGCQGQSSSSPLTFQQEQQARIQELESSLIHDLNMSSSLNSRNDIDDCMDLMEDFAKRMTNCHEIYLCLYPDWDAAPESIRELADPGTSDADSAMLLKFAVKDGKRLPECTFQKKQPLPDYVFEQGHYAYIYTPLFSGDQAFGYLAFSFHNNRIDYPFSYVSWIMNVNNMLNNICHGTHMKLLAERLEFLSRFDPLTGHYNRHTFLQEALVFLEDSSAQGLPVTACSFRLSAPAQASSGAGSETGSGNSSETGSRNGSETGSGNSSETGSRNGSETGSGNSSETDSLETDFAARIVGQALKQALEEGSLCGRIQPGEFYVLNHLASDSEARTFQKKVEHYLTAYNRLHSRSCEMNLKSSFSRLDVIPKTEPETILAGLFQRPAPGC